MPGLNCDIVFLIDANRGIRDTISNLQDSIVDFAATLVPPCSEGFFRAKVVGYRDVERLDYVCPWIDNNPFTASVDELKAQFGSIKPIGVEGAPTSLLDALIVIANMGEPQRKGETADEYQWRNRLDAFRLIIVFTDNPYQSKAVLPFHNSATFEEVAHIIDAQRIYLTLVTPVPSLASVNERARKPFEAMYDDLGCVNCGEYIQLRDHQGNAFSLSSNNLKTFLHDLAGYMRSHLRFPK